MWGNLKISMQIHCIVLDSLVCLDHHWLLFVWVGNTELNKWKKNVPVYHSWKLFKVEIGVQTYKKGELSKQMSIIWGLATIPRPPWGRLFFRRKVSSHWNTHTHTHTCTSLHTTGRCPCSHIHAAFIIANVFSMCWIN